MALANSARARLPSSSAALVAAILAASPIGLNASTIWDGGGASPTWGTAANWSDDVAPTFNNATNLSFPTSAVTNFNSVLGANRIIRSMTFGADVDSAFGVNYSQSVGGTSQTLTMGGGADAPFITVDSGSTGAITLGNPLGTNVGSMILAANLAINHNGSGLLLFNRGISGTGFGLAKNGSGTMQLNSFNTFTGAITINSGKLIANTFGSAGQDLNAASAINLAGGSLEIGASSGTSKEYATVPVNVTAASTLIYNNANATTYTAQFTGSSAFALGADLAVQNTSSTTSNVNALNISRGITGTGKLQVEGYNNIASSAANYSLGRLLITGNNSGWSGDLVIAKGTASLGGTATTGTSSGTGKIVIGTTGDAFGAGLTFFSQATNGTTVTYANDITVRSGGFRSIKAGGTDHNMALTGDIALEGTLNVDHTMFVPTGFPRSFTLGGDISGVGGLDITRAGGGAASYVVLSGTNTYEGDTTVATGASLIVNGSLTSDISVATGGRFGGDGSTSGNLTLASGALFAFSPTTTFDVTGLVSLDASFGVSSLVNPDGSPVDWTLVGDGVYTIIGSTLSDFSHIQNFGLANAADLGTGRSAYFQNGSLELVVIPEPSTYAAIAGAAILGIAALFRRRQR